MINTELVVIDVAASVPPQAIALSPDLPKQYASILHKLLEIKGRGNDWIRTYKIPGRKLLRKIVGEAYSVFLSIEKSQNRAYVYERLAVRLRSDKVRVHADAPKSTLVVRTVFPSLDPSRVSKYARSLDAAREKDIKAELFEEFVASAGGFEKIRLAPVAILVPGQAAKVATPDSFKLVVPPVDVEDVDDLNDEEMVELEFGDELHELLRHRQSEQLLAVATLTAEQESLIDQSLPERLVLIAELREGRLCVFDQVPYVEDAIAKAYRARYPTCQDLRDAIS